MFVWFLCISSWIVVNSYQLLHHTRPLYFRESKISRTKLSLDFFGLGPAEIAIIIGVGGLLYGPGVFDRKKFNQSNEEKVVGESWEREMEADLEEKRKRANRARYLRSLKRFVESPEE